MKHIVTLAVMATLMLTFAACTEKETDEPKPETVVSPNPRYMAAANGKLYVSCYNPSSVLRIDTATHSVEAVCRLGDYNPEGVAIAGGRLFVASSWIQEENGNTLYDSAVYVIDLTTFSVLQTVKVGLNPDRLRAVDDRYVVVGCNGNYGDRAADSYIIDATTLDARRTGINMTSLCTYNGLVYAYSSPHYGSTDVTFLTLDPVSLDADTIMRGCDITMPFGIDVIEGDVYVTTADIMSATGEVHRFAPSGTRVWRSETGIYTSRTAALGDGTAYVLNQGAWSANDASLDRINLGDGTVQRNVFATANKRGLGDIAQDILVYGSKAYVTVTFSNSIETVSLADNTSVRIAL